MKSKTYKQIFGYILSSIFSGLVFGVLMYFSDAEKNIKYALFQGIFFGIGMGLFDVFIKPRIDNYYSKKNKKQQQL